MFLIIEKNGINQYSFTYFFSTVISQNISCEKAPKWITELCLLAEQHKTKNDLTENRKRCCYSHSLEFLGLGPKKFWEIFLAENGVMTVSGTSRPPHLTTTWPTKQWTPPPAGGGPTGEPIHASPLCLSRKHFESEVRMVCPLMQVFKHLQVFFTCEGRQIDSWIDETSARMWMLCPAVVLKRQLSMKVKLVKLCSYPNLWPWIRGNNSAKTIMHKSVENELHMVAEASGHHFTTIWWMPLYNKLDVTPLDFCNSTRCATAAGLKTRVYEHVGVHDC